MKGFKLIIRRLPDNELFNLQPLFEKVFNHSISLDLLHWKYAGQHGESWVALDADGHITMHCGLNFRNILLGDKTARAAQLTDLMAPPKVKGLTRQDSPFAKLLYQIYINLPRPENTEGIAFGFPSGRAMKLAEYMGRSREVDQLMDLEFSPLKNINTGTCWRELVKIDLADERIIEAIWLKMAKDFSEFVIGIRDAKYIKHRYLAYPDKRYTLLIIEKKGFWYNSPIGLAVIGPGNERRELLDVVCSAGDMQIVIQTVQCWLAENNGEVLQFSLTERFSKRLEVFADRCKLTQFRISGNPFSSTTINTRLDRRWWLTGGDTDYR